MLDALLHADAVLLDQHVELLHADVVVHFESDVKVWPQRAGATAMQMLCLSSLLLLLLLRPLPTQGTLVPQQLV